MEAQIVPVKQNLIISGKKGMRESKEEEMKMDSKNFLDFSHEERTPNPNDSD